MLKYGLTFNGVSVLESGKVMNAPGNQRNSFRAFVYKAMVTLLGDRVLVKP